MGCKGYQPQLQLQHSFSNLVGGRTNKVLMPKIMCRCCRICIKAERKKKSVRKHKCIVNYQGSSKGMEAQSILEMEINAP